MRTTITILLVLLMNMSFGQININLHQNMIRMNSELSYKMMDPVEDLRKVTLAMEARKKGMVGERGLIIGASLITIADAQWTNTDHKFGYLMRHPTGSNQVGDFVSEAVIHSFQLSFVGVVNNWIAACTEVLYNPEQSFGAGTLVDLNRNQLQVRKGVILFGDLNKLPIYGAIGKMDVPFGQTGTVSPFTSSTMWHAFGALAYGAQIGVKTDNFQFVFMGIQGGAQFRAANMPVGDSLDVPSLLNNFSADINYRIDVTEDVELRIGGSYIHGCAYCQDWPITHFMPCDTNNPAATAYGKLTIDDRVTLKGGWAKTLDVWPGTFNPNPPLNQYPAHKVSSLDLGAKVKINPKGKVVYSASAEFSDFHAGPAGAPWERQNQIVVGVQGMIQKSSKIFIEGFRTDGYVPLNWVSGGNLPDPGETHSVRDAFSHGVVVGAQVTL